MNTELRDKILAVIKESDEHPTRGDIIKALEKESSKAVFLEINDMLREGVLDNKIIFRLKIREDEEEPDHHFGIIYRKLDEKGRTVFMMTKLRQAVCIESTRYDGDSHSVSARSMQMLGMDEVREISEALSSLFDKEGE